MLSWFREQMGEQPYSMQAVYVCAGISKQGYFKKLAVLDKRQGLESLVIEKVKQARQDHPRMGSRPLYYLIKPEAMGINSFEKLLRSHRLTLEKRRSYLRTTNSNHGFRHYTNLVNGKELTSINQVWVGDITYYITIESVYYITFIEDVYSRRILGYHVSQTMHAVEIAKALQQAFDTRKGDCLKDLIHHSDRGGQYCSDLYTGMLSSRQISISMARSCLENSYAERINGTIKNQYLADIPIKNLQQLREQVKHAVMLYNQQRPHRSLAYSTPVAFENSLSSLPLTQRKVTKMYDFSQD